MTVGNSAPHSAVDLEKTSAEGVNASARGRPRETSDESAQSQPQSAVTFSEWIAGLKEWATPPDIVTEDRPSLQKTAAYAMRGEWTTSGGVYRRAGQAYMVFALVVKTACYSIDWVTERPTRLAAAAVLVWLLAQFPPLSWLI